MVVGKCCWLLLVVGCWLLVVDPEAFLLVGWRTRLCSICLVVIELAGEMPCILREENLSAQNTDSLGITAL